MTAAILASDVSFLVGWMGGGGSCAEIYKDQWYEQKTKWEKNRESESSVQKQ